VVELYDKGMTVEKTVTFGGKKESPYHIVGEHDKFAVTWGPFAEQKKIQVALYWTDAVGNGLDPIDTVKELSDDKNCTKVTLLSVHHHDNQNNLTLRTVINVTCMKVKG
jgi:DNA-binding NarL/FixJ family response regulator